MLRWNPYDPKHYLQQKLFYLFIYRHTYFNKKQLTLSSYYIKILQFGQQNFTCFLHVSQKIFV